MRATAQFFMMNGMSPFSDVLDGLRRRYIALPPFLIVGFLAVFFFLTGSGQARLQEAGEELQKSADRQLAIEELQASLFRSVASQRGFLLTGDQKYLRYYEGAVAKIEPRLERLRLAYAGTEAGKSSVRTLQLLVGKRLADLGMIIALQQKEGSRAALALLETSVGTDAGQAITTVLDQLRDIETANRQAAAGHWSSSLTVSRWITAAATIFNMLLIGVAARLVYLDMRRRGLRNAELRDQKSRLEHEVAERTQALVELSTHLQDVAERDKARLARELHDELGGLLVGARMDISWAEQHLAHDDPALQLRLHRVQQNLAAGVDLKRRIIEELRPTLLDNVGLLAALRWQLRETCGRAGLKCIESYPDEEPRFKSDAAIALFRIAQEAFSNILTHSSASTVNMSLEMDQDTLLMRIADDGTGITEGRLTAVGSRGLASMRHRVRALGGRLDLRAADEGGTLLIIRVPADRVLQQAGAPEHI